MSDGPKAATSALFLCPPPKWPLLQPRLSTSSLLTPTLGIFHLLSQSHSPPFPSLCLRTDLYKPPHWAPFLSGFPEGLITGQHRRAFREG